MLKISVIATILHSDKYIREYLDSTVNQTLSDIEIICINFVTSESINELLNEYIQKDNRIKKIDKKNKNATAVINEEINQAKGEYIIFSDTNGYYTANDAFEALYRGARENNVLAAGGKINNIKAINDLNSNLFKTNAVMRYADYQMDCGYEGFIFNRDFLKESKLFFPNFEFYADSVFFVKAMIKAGVFYATKKCIYYRGNEHPNVIRSSGKIADMLRGIRIILVLAKEYSLAKLHYMTVLRMETPPYWPLIRRRLVKFDLKTITNFIKAQNSIDMKLLRDLEPAYNKKLCFRKAFNKIAGFSTNHNKPDRQLLNYLNDEIWNMKQDQKFFLEFLDFCFLSNVRENTILFIEPTNSHGEVIPGYAKYLLTLGYNLDILMVPELAEMEPMCRVSDDRVHCYTIPFSYFGMFFNYKEKIHKYRAIFFSSSVIYMSDNPLNNPAVFDQFPQLNQYMDKTISVEHHFDRVDYDLLGDDRIITLADFYGERKITVNPHSFGAVKITPKNKQNTVFITVGNIERCRKNHALLIQAVKKLHSCNIRNFKIIVIGRGEFGDTSEDVKGFFDIRGRVNFPEMYEAMEEADFFLPLLDPEIQDHYRYLSCGTTGSFQLIYGFRKPCLINRVFSDKHGFNEKNALIYSQNSDLAECIKLAIEMNQNDYENLQKGLSELSSSIEEQSLEVLKRIINRG